MALYRHARRAAIFAVALLTAGSAVAACSSSANSTSQSSVDGLTKSPIVIGNVSTLSGPSTGGPVGSILPTLKAWVAYENANGGIKGHPIKLVSMDDGGNSAKGVADVQNLVQNDHIVALVGESDINVELAWEKYADSAKIPVIGGFANGLEWDHDPDFFPSSTTGQAYTVSTTETAVKEGGKVFGFPYCVEEVTCKQVVPIIQGSAEADGMKWGGAVAVSQSAPSYTAPCLQLKNAGVNVIMNADSAPLRFADACGQQNFTPIQILVGAEANVPGLLQDPVFNGRTFIPEASFPWFVHNDQTATFFTAMQKYAPGVAPDANATVEWVAGLMFAAAANAVSGTVTPASLVAALHNMKDETLGGLAPGALNMSNPSFHPVNCFFIVAVKDGKFIAPNGLNTTCVDPKSYAALQQASS
jgi:branched-chain amino acid transport system substrate-binding protein